MTFKTELHLNNGLRYQCIDYHMWEVFGCC